MKIVNRVSIVLCISLCAIITMGCGGKNMKEYDIEPIVSVEGGQIEGEYVNKGTDVRERTYEDVLVFKGVPYAAPPTGQNRWRAPQDVVPWDGVKQCKTFSPNPYQAKTETPIGQPYYEFTTPIENGYSEDCLTLNIWTNGKPRKGGMPVIFFIYGGSYIEGSNAVEVYNGEYLASQEVILVTVNYRLNIFGWFTSTELAERDTEGTSGNYGLQDLIKALVWCKNNIEAFGGDPDNITLYGSSAGAGLINSLLASPKTDGLFARAIPMSYPQDALVKPLYPITLEERKRMGDLMAEDAGGFDKLMAMSDKELYDFYIEENAKGRAIFIGPCKDGIYWDMDFRQAMEAGRKKNVDVIVGVCHNPNETNIADDSAFMLFFGINENMYSTSDALMIVVNSYVKARLKGGATNTRFAQFNHVTPGPELKGAFHGSDINYVFNYFTPLRKGYWTEKDYETGNICSAYLINFARTGNPSGKTPSGKALTEWEPATGQYDYFAIDNECKQSSLDQTKTGYLMAYLMSKGYDFI